MSGADLRRRADPGRVRERVEAAFDGPSAVGSLRTTTSSQDRATGPRRADRHRQSPPGWRKQGRGHPPNQDRIITGRFAPAGSGHR